MVELFENRFVEEQFSPVYRKESLEVEEQAKLDPGQDLEIQNRILRMGGSHVANEYIEDTFYCPAGITSFEELEQRSENEQIIRIRKSIIQDESGQTSTITTLTTKSKGGTPESGWNEHLFQKSGDAVSEATSLLLRDGDLKPYYHIKKNRSEWKLGDTSISFDSIADYGVFMEAERLADAKKEADTRSEIKAMMKQLGVRQDQKPKSSIMRDLLRTRAFIST